jgi:hypothetical protein
MRSELVSVVVPAYNAESTLRATLASVRAQTYRRLEIIVVDDGSTDGTGGLVREAAALDGRIRLLSIDNSGVAAARNAGIAASRGAYVAPVDADDLWHPEKIARQVAAIEAGGPEVGYVYTLFRRIDAEDRVIHDGPPWDISGAVFLRLLLYNFVGNGSSLLIRRAAIEGAGGYEPDLRIQGSEDYLAQIVLARRWKVALVPEYLTGYRQSASSMSRNRVRMEQSTLLMIERIRQRFPEAPEELLAAAEATIRARLAVTHLVNRRRAVQAAKEFARALRSAPAEARAVAAHELRNRLGRMIRRRLGGVRPAGNDGAAGRFLDREPQVAPGQRVAHPIVHRLDGLVERDEAFFRSAGAAPPAPQPAWSPEEALPPLMAAAGRAG